MRQRSRDTETEQTNRIALIIDCRVCCLQSVLTLLTDYSIINFSLFPLSKQIEMSPLINGSCSWDQCYLFCVLCLCTLRDITLLHKQYSDVGTEILLLFFLSHTLWTTTAAWCHITQYVIPGMSVLSRWKARVRDRGLFVKSARPNEPCAAQPALT